MFRSILPLRAYLSFSALLAGIAIAPASFADTISYVSEPGDWVGQGQTLSLSNGLVAYASSDGNMVYAYVTDGTVQGGHNLVLELHAPLGQQLQPGVYADVKQSPDASHGGLYFGGDGRGCGSLRGSFTITALTLGPYGYVQKLEAIWEQKCDYSTGSLFGQISINKPAPPAPMVFVATADAGGVIDKTSNVATVSGTVKCSMQSSAEITGSVLQAPGRSKNVAYSDFLVRVPCGPTASRWSANVTSYGNAPFAQGLAQFDVHATAYDPVYYLPNEQTISTVVQLDNAKHALISETGARIRR